MAVPHSTKTAGHGRQQANQLLNGSSVFARPGFSLIELLIVIAILTIVTAFVLPSLRGPLDRAKLRSAAVDVKKAWGKARSVAIRDGFTTTFRCKIGGRYWKIERDLQIVSLDSSDTTREIPLGLNAETAAYNQQPEHDKRELIREGWLPQGSTFRKLTLAKSESPMQDASVFNSEQSSSLSDSASAWSDPLKFHPAGRSEDAQLRVAGADRFVVDVTIRGLTSNVSFAAPFLARRSADDAGAP